MGRQCLSTPEVAHGGQHLYELHEDSACCGLHTLNSSLEVLKHSPASLFLTSWNEDLPNALVGFCRCCPWEALVRGWAGSIHINMLGSITRTSGPQPPAHCPSHHRQLGYGSTLPLFHSDRAHVAVEGCTLHL